MPPIIPNKSQSATSSNTTTSTSTQNTTNTQQDTETVDLDSTLGKTPSQINREDKANYASQSETADSASQREAAQREGDAIQAQSAREMTQAENNTAYVATQRDPLNVRVGEGTDTSVITTAERGSQVEIIEPDNGSGWTKVRLEDGTEGYVSSEYLSTNNVSNSSGSYTVQSGDTLSEIAEAHGMSYQELAEYNNIDNPDLIFPGQEIRFPSNGSDSASNSAIDSSGGSSISDSDANSDLSSSLAADGYSDAAVAIISTIQADHDFLITENTPEYFYAMLEELKKNDIDTYTELVGGLEDYEIEALGIYYSIDYAVSETFISTDTTPFTDRLQTALEVLEYDKANNFIVAHSNPVLLNQNTTSMNGEDLAGLTLRFFNEYGIEVTAPLATVTMNDDGTFNYEFTIDNEELIDKNVRTYVEFMNYINSNYSSEEISNIANNLNGIMLMDILDENGNIVEYDNGYIIQNGYLLLSSNDDFTNSSTDDTPTTTVASIINDKIHEIMDIIGNQTASITDISTDLIIKMAELFRTIDNANEDIPMDPATQEWLDNVRTEWGRILDTIDVSNTEQSPTLTMEQIQDIGNAFASVWGNITDTASDLGKSIVDPYLDIIDNLFSNDDSETEAVIREVKSEEEVLSGLSELLHSLSPADGTWIHRCGELVSDQLIALGLITDEARVNSGKDQARAIYNNGKTQSGFETEGFEMSGSNADERATFEQLINNYDGVLSNVIISFDQSGGLGPHGHVVNIAQIQDGYVYFFDNTGYAANASVEQYNGASVAKMTIEEFENTYIDAWDVSFMTHIITPDDVPATGDSQIEAVVEDTSTSTIEDTATTNTVEDTSTSTIEDDTDSSNIATIQAGGGLYLRTGPGKENSSITLLENGSEVEILDGDLSKDGWIKVRAGEQIGWVSSQYLLKGTAEEIFNERMQQLFQNEGIDWDSIDFPTNAAIQQADLNTQAFIYTIAYYAIKENNRRAANGENTIPPSVCIAMAMHESGVNLNSPSLFGIKAQEGDKSASYLTYEEVNGQMVQITADFAQYDSIEDAVKAYYRFIDNGSSTNTYAPALNLDSAYDTLYYIKQGGYATGSDYVEHVWDNYLSYYDLTIFDAPNILSKKKTKQTTNDESKQEKEDKSASSNATIEEKKSEETNIETTESESKQESKTIED